MVNRNFLHNVFLHKVRGTLMQIFHAAVFIGIMTLVFHLTFNVVGEALRGFLAQGIGEISMAAEKLLVTVNAPLLLRSLVLDGIFPGVGSVLSFVPTIGTLFFFLSLLEESGYLSYVATLMDKPMRCIGLTGRAVVPLISGFGCNVPAIMTAGSLLKGRGKTMVIAMMPFMSCSARLPIYAIFITAFFEKRRLLVLAAVYGVGIAVAILTALLMKKFHGNDRFSSVSAPCHPESIKKSHSIRAVLRSTLRTVWQNCVGFIKKACTVILLASVIIWFLRTFGTEFAPVDDIGDSLLAALGKTAVPIFEPLGFGDWRASSALISGLFAKETIISTLAMLSASGSGVFTPLSAFCFMVFCLLYIPCIPTLAAIKQETDSIKFCITLCLFQLIIAWLVSFLIFQAGAL